MNPARSTAAPNFALIKYWGKASDERMIPAAPSLSITLDGPVLELTIEPHDGSRDEVLLEDRPVPEAWRARTARFLDMIRTRSGEHVHARVQARGGPVPASGLASSAAYFAALAQACASAWGLPRDTASVSDLARRGSVSAARSVPGGFVVLDPKHESQGRLPARTVHPAEHWDLCIVIAVIRRGPKTISSSEGMRLSRETSPYYGAWCETCRQHLDLALASLGSRDFDGLARLSEVNCLRMHACAMASEPPVVYLAPETLAVMDRVISLRSRGVRCFYTVDAGPQVKVVCQAEDVEGVRDGLSDIPGVLELLVHAAGHGSTG
jgi:diphosphomevalonate decarboxylase